MANIKSSKKSIELDAKNTVKNKAQTTKIANTVKSYKTAVAANDTDKAKELLKVATSTIDTACSKGTLHKKCADRKKSRLSSMLNDKK